MIDPRPRGCCGKCPPIVGGGYDCTCKGNPRCRREKRRARREQRAWDAYNDHWNWLWYARYWLSPSRIRKAEERLAKLSDRLDYERGE